MPKKEEGVSSGGERLWRRKEKAGESRGREEEAL